MQSYQPINENQPKRFVNVADLNDDDHFYYPYHYELNGDSSIFSQYFRLSQADLAIDSNFACPSWGSNEGSTGDTTWLGRTLIYEHSTNILHLSNSLQEPLIFEFNIALGDSSLFYANSQDEYYIKYSAATEEVVLGQTDSIKYYTILHYDLIGTQVNQGLNGFNIKIGKVLGLLQFIDCHQFPNEEIGYELMGQLHPNIGKYRLTYDEVYPWQVGDQLQYLGTYSDCTVYPIVNKTYTMYTVEDRIETTDSVWLYFSSVGDVIYSPSNGQFNPGTTYNIILGDSLGFEKGKNLSEYPSGMMPYQGTGDYQFTRFSNPCGTGSKEELNYDPDWSAYCDSCQCLLPYDGFVTFLYPKIYRAGYGLVSSSIQVYGQQTQPGYTASLVYSFVDGVACGTPIYATVGELNHQLAIFPNPVQDQFRIVADETIELVTIYDLNGKQLRTFVPTNQQESIDVSFLAPGVYAVNSMVKSELISVQLVKM